MLDHQKEIVKKLNAVIRENNLEKFLSFFTDDIQWTKVGDKSAKGKEALRRLIESLGDAQPPSTIAFESMIAEGDTVAAYGRLTIQVQDGKTIVQDFCDIYRFRGDQIVELRAFIITPNETLEPGQRV
jgi:uncharacterized protein